MFHGFSLYSPNVQMIVKSARANCRACLQGYSSGGETAHRLILRRAGAFTDLAARLQIAGHFVPLTYLCGIDGEKVQTGQKLFRLPRNL